MFSALERYRLIIAVRSSAGERRLPLSRLTPHLSYDARRIILPAASGGLGRDQTSLLAAGLPDLARLVCQLEADATSVRLTLLRGPVRARELSPTELELSCSTRR
jgi:hypothetical protein